MRQKIDIADVEAATKIRAKYLRALENEEFGLLPGPTFVKTFLRTYADYLGLDAQLLVEEYRVQHEPRGEEFAPIARPSPRERDRRNRRPRRNTPGPGAVIFGAVVLILIFLLVLGLTDGGDDGGGDNDRASQQEPREPDQSAEEKKAAEERAARRKRREARARRARAAARKRVTLKLTPSEPTYACVVDGNGKQLFGGTLSEADTFTAKRIKINLGRTTIKVTVNKKSLDIPPSSNPVGYDLRPGKAPVELPDGSRPSC
jgi:cytoskeleton protein RodZ